MGDALDPVGELLVEVVDGGEPARGEEAVAQVLDRALHLALLVAAVRRARHRREVIVPGALEDLRVEADVLADAFDDDALEVVVEDPPRHAAEPLECQGVAAQERLEGLVEREARVHRARPRQHQHEARQRPRRGADLDLAEVAPVHLRLLARQRGQPEERLGARRRSHRAYVPLHRVVAAQVAAGPDHLEDARRA